MAYAQENRKLSVDTPLGKDVVLLVGLNGREAISQLFSFRLDLLAENKVTVAFDKVLGQKCTAHIDLPGGGKRHINGICNRMSQAERGRQGQDLGFTSYRMELVPKFWLLTRKTQSRIFQQLAVPDILKKVLAGLDLSVELQGTYEPRDYCVQYRETDFAFASRLMEEEGIYYYFKHSDGDHTMVLTDSPTSHPSVPGPTSLIYEEVEGGARDEDRVLFWEKTQELRSGKVTLWDHCFELPHKHLEAEKIILDSVPVGTVTHKLKIADNTKLELYDWPGEYAQRFDGVDKGGGDRPADLQKIFLDNRRTTGIRMEQEEMPSLLIQGRSNARHIVPGHKFDLDRHFNANGSYVLLSVSHAVHNAVNYASGEEAPFAYENAFTCIPDALGYRPPRVVPRPTVKGTQTAVVVGPPGEEIFTDKYGRVKVQFHWDREGKNDIDSSCWIRVAQLMAGRRWGSSFWPRIGQEVLVDFEEGDPDRPVIIGCVYNADQMPPYLGKGPDPKHPNDNKVSGIKTSTTQGGAGFNELRFDDTKGKEQVFIHSEKDMDVRVKNDSREAVGNDKHLIVGGVYEGQKHGDYREKVFQDRHIKVERNQEEQIGGSYKLLVGKGDGDGGDLDLSIARDLRQTIGLGYDLKVENNRHEKVDGNQSLDVGGSQQEKVGTNHALEAGQSIHIKAGMTCVIEAGMQLTLKVGGNFIDINPMGVSIQGTMVMINSGGAAGSGSGSSPDSPESAKEASPTAPDEADDAKTGRKSCS